MKRRDGRESIKGICFHQLRGGQTPWLRLALGSRLELGTWLASFVKVVSAVTVTRKNVLHSLEQTATAAGCRIHSIHCRASRVPTRRASNSVARPVYNSIAILAAVASPAADNGRPETCRWHPRRPLHSIQMLTQANGRVIRSLVGSYISRSTSTDVALFLIPSHPASSAKSIRTRFVSNKNRQIYDSRLFTEPAPIMDRHRINEQRFVRSDF